MPVASTCSAGAWWCCASYCAACSGLSGGALVVVEASALRVGGLVVVQVRVPLVERLIGASCRAAIAFAIDGGGGGVGAPLAIACSTAPAEMVAPWADVGATTCTPFIVCCAIPPPAPSENADSRPAMPALLMRSSTFRPVPVSVETCVSSYAPLFGIEVVRRKNAVGVGRERGLELRVEQQALERIIEVAITVSYSTANFGQ